jgi:formylglycine-generating enzyme required for sulfatase activity
MSYIFISYSHKDKEYAHRLEKALKLRGFEVWLDDRIDYGAQWPKTIAEELDGCKALILIMTVHSYDSDWVQNELSRAKRKRKNIFPLLLEGDEPWLSVEATQYVDVRGGNLPPTAFYDTLAKVVPRKGVETSEQIEVKPTSEAAMPTNLFKSLPPSFHNFFELESEYILIPGGRYKYQGKTEKEVSNVYFAKYPVTNRLYRRFIRYLEEKERELLKILPKGEFDKRMIEFASGIKGFGNYLGNKPNSWPETLHSEYDTDKLFNGDDQPVVGISWFAARAYCYWLSLLEATGENLSYDNARGLYRLPSEIEWEWAASGGKRKYPWASEKGLPSDKLANYGEDVRATTPVGRYPGGATPEGLMDMTGNVWEWMENWAEKYEGKYRSARGGSWSLHGVFNLRCSVRDGSSPDDRRNIGGFRVVRSQP